ncbi:UDP-N-acetylglucosamine 2-epimerase (hydrolyzing) [Halomonas marinisediminis]|uniref:UDP-N-acetylglucosamine 2-epimerase (Hydrolyzing) n=2 Tax=Halomonas marinisediminis TaxID=2546095 RepID=A0ABY2D3A4_9GAMM|nr:UDP-N-acetylglucosamine 2-epimerase (hydrolyzing) [Halomonas marinisediminis]
MTARRLMSARRLWVLTSTRADFGLLYWLLREIDNDPDLELMLAVTGTHLSPEFGMTVQDIEKTGLPIHRRMEILLSSDTRTAMTTAMGLAMLECGQALAADQPDMVVLLGDRFEIVPVALAAVAHGIPVAHLHGGETSSGAVDEYFRHAVTKLASFHFPATEAYRRRIIQMGEDPARVFNLGAPGLDHLHHSETVGRTALFDTLGLDPKRPTALVTYHPVTGDIQGDAHGEVAALLEALASFDGLQCVFTKANADTQGRAINAQLQAWCEANPQQGRLFDNLGQRLYHGCLRHLDLVVGNSSSGLVEAPSFRRPVVNVGKRQQGRITAANVISTSNDAEAIREGIRRALDADFKDGLLDMHNPYDRFGDGTTSRRIKDMLASVELTPQLLQKRFHDISIGE